MPTTSVHRRAPQRRVKRPKCRGVTQFWLTEDLVLAVVVSVVLGLVLGGTSVAAWYL